MAKSSKQSDTSKIARDARTGQFVVVKPAVGPKRFTAEQIRRAVRKFMRDEAASKS